MPMPAFLIYESESEIVLTRLKLNREAPIFRIWF
jgi:hypothetical protein